MKPCTAILLALFAVGGICRAQEPSATPGTAASLAPVASPSGHAFTPITLGTETGYGKYGEYTFSQYEHDGTVLTDSGQFEAVIDPLGDSLASREIRLSGEDNAWGFGLAGAGFGVAIGDLFYSVLYYDSLDHQQLRTYPRLVPLSSLLGVGIVAGTSGILLIMQGSRNFDAAIERYNHVVQGLHGFSLLVPGQEDGLGLAYVRRF